MKKSLAMLLVIVMVAALFAGSVQAFAEEPTDEEYAAWAEEHGYVLNPEENGYMKLGEELASSATENKAGGVNYGAIEWSEELQVAAVKEWLKGGTYVGDDAFRQDASGYNYREMYQMATCYNNVPSNTNLELVLDADNLHLLGVSEGGTGKTLEFAVNPVVSVSWVKQLRLAEEELGYNYYCSYGVTINGEVVIYSAADLETEEGQATLINLFDKYYPTLGSTWAAYSRLFADKTDEAEIKAAKLGYIGNLLASGTMVIYEVVPSKIIITCPFMINMAPQMNNALMYATVKEGEDKYAYCLDITDEFLDMVIAYKNEYLSNPDNVAAVEAYYTSGMFPMLDEYCAMYGAPTSLQLAMMPTTAAGMKTQTTWTPAA